jgi:hypothetical protein
MKNNVTTTALLLGNKSCTTIDSFGQKNGSKLFSLFLSFILRQSADRPDYLSNPIRRFVSTISFNF